jgi:hypothetical protein
MKRISIFAGAVALMALLPPAAQAQFEGQQPPPFRPQGQGRPGQPGQPGQPGRFPGQPPMGQMGPMGPRLSLATLPSRVLENGLSLTDDQKEKLRDIREQRPEGPPQGPPPGQGFGGQPGFGPGRGTNPNAAREIKAMLTDKQKEMVPQLLKDAALLGPIGIPIDLAGTIKLNEDQRAKLIQIAFHARPEFSGELQEAQESRDPEKSRSAMENLRKETRQKVFGVLTAEQKTAVEKWEKDHPRPEPGGPGRRGGFNGPGGPSGPNGPGGFNGPDGPPPYP